MEVYSSTYWSVKSVIRTISHDDDDVRKEEERKVEKRNLWNRLTEFAVV